MDTRALDKDAQTIFVRLASFSDDPQELLPFAVYCGYEVIVNGRELETETAAVMERLFLLTEDEAVGAALWHLYERGLETENRRDVCEKAVSWAESRALYFPCMSGWEGRTPFMERNKPFLYRGVPNRKVFLMCRFGESEPAPVPMRYFRFGVYLASVEWFCGETVAYSFCEETKSGSLITREETAVNGAGALKDPPADPYDRLNNAIVYTGMFRHEQAEEMIANELRDPPRIWGWII
jgi:hypothetical protein